MACVVSLVVAAAVSMDARMLRALVCIELALLPSPFHAALASKSAALLSHAASTIEARQGAAHIVPELTLLAPITIGTAADVPLRLGLRSAAIFHFRSHSRSMTLASVLAGHRLTNPALVALAVLPRVAGRALACIVIRPRILADRTVHARLVMRAVVEVVVAHGAGPVELAHALPRLARTRAVLAARVRHALLARVALPPVRARALTRRLTPTVLAAAPATQSGAFAKLKHDTDGL